MRLILVTMIASIICWNVRAQNTVRMIVKDSTTQEKLIGVTLRLNGLSIGTTSDINGNILLGKIPNGEQLLLFSYVGYKNKQLPFSFPTNSNEIIVVELVSEFQKLDEVTVGATRTNSRIEDLPMKVEVLGLEDMEEEGSIKPASIASILGDLSVIHIQQTSSINGSSVIRMQGLDGKYTQLLRDGLPLYEGFSGSFGVLQIPPLDLKQVEIIKGSTSTLYGGGAIAGMINLVSKTPTKTRDFSILMNHSSLKESNLNTYFSQQFGKIGLTFFGGYTTQNAMDINQDGFSDVPEIKHLTLHPRLFYNFSDKTTASLGFSYLTETRTGGDMQAIGTTHDFVHTYFQRNENERTTIDFQVAHDFSKNHKLTAKGTSSIFSRILNQYQFGFSGKQLSAYFEISDFIKANTSEWVWGINSTTERFTKALPDSTLLQNFTYQTTGFFIQNGWHISPKFLMETGLRVDFHTIYGSFLLPRIAFLYKHSPNFSLRLSSGLGYKTPNVFSAATTAGGFRELSPIASSIKSERSQGVNMDINYHFNVGKLITVTLNQAFYYSNIENPIITTKNSAGLVSLSNTDSRINSLGTDTYIRFSFDDIELYLGYNHTVAQRIGNGSYTFLAFSPQDKFSSTLAYEIEGKWRFGVENSWIGNQYATIDPYNLMQLRQVANYWFWAGMIERKFGTKISLVLNAENWFDYRQSNTEPLVAGTTKNPTFASLWAPIDGRVMNLALRIKF